MKREKKRQLNKKKIIRLFLLILIVIFIIGILIFVKNMKSNSKAKPNVNVIDTVSVYTLDDNETSYYKNLFSQLKAELNKTSIDEQKYATLLSQLFISDFFTLSNKISKNDIGGIQFIYNDYRNDFEKNAKETIYHSVESNIYGDRNQNLPAVHSVEIINITKKEYNYLKKTDENAYFIDLQITYEKDLGYQKSASLVLVHNNDLLEIVKMSNK